MFSKSASGRFTSLNLGSIASRALIMLTLCLLGLISLTREFIDEAITNYSSAMRCPLYDLELSILHSGESKQGHNVTNVDIPFS